MIECEALSVVESLPLVLYGGSARWAGRNCGRFGSSGEERKESMSSTTRRPGARPRLWVPTLYFAEGLPFYAVSMMALIFYSRMGVNNGTITATVSLLGLPWSLKPLWSPFLEMYKTKKFFVVLMEFVGGLSLGPAGIVPAAARIFPLQHRVLGGDCVLLVDPRHCSGRALYRQPDVRSSRQPTRAGRAGSTTWRASFRRADC